ncbi:Molybdopterin biosynthesis MoaE [Gonapodya prolifera JEL478]|uniref:Molybdopterin synthase catalytic subunit n=1 Tax=Gonapodya prolifera (strain JEL478) TaxID=1344416 RepID=A0A139AJ71_GONPJ|nr:Molybdopterin biosynthesis MoaE [Gonapodya prolifera JEL478]|eukprot:KXS16861.1 Molybdopterin biosynthesis MoaE [Gonapodya prolifera JEL478]
MTSITVNAPNSAPPISTITTSTPTGGITEVSIVDSPYDARAIADACKDPSCGAISTFEGTTRNTFEGKRVLSLHYESYVPMALKELHHICLTARTSWPSLVHVRIAHRIGSVPVGEGSVFVAASSPHRREAIEAVEWMVDELKATVPIWKREVYEDGSVWKANTECVGCVSRRRSKLRTSQEATHDHHPHKNGYGHRHTADGMGGHSHEVSDGNHAHRNGSAA